MGPFDFISNNSDNYDGNNSDALDGGFVGKEERKERVLAFLVDARLALPRLALYRNLAYQGATFSDSSLQNYLAELRKEGYVERVDAKAFAKGEVVVTDSDPGYWIATTEGADRIENLRTDQRRDIKTDHL